MITNTEVNYTIKELKLLQNDYKNTQDTSMKYDITLAAFHKTRRLLGDCMSRLDESQLWEEISIIESFDWPLMRMDSDMTYFNGELDHVKVWSIVGDVVKYFDSGVSCLT